MAVLNLYMNQNAGASDLNSGSTSVDGGGTDSPVYTSTGGNFDGTSVFTPTDGSTPSGSVSAGMWANFYNTGDTLPRCVAKISAVGAGVNGTITLDTANKFGTVPTVNSGSRAIKVGGAWTSLAAPANLGSITAPTSYIINVKAATYANTTTSRALNIAGGAGIFPWIIRGYKTTPGDRDNAGVADIVNWSLGTDVPYFTFTTGVLTVGGKDCLASSFAVTSASTTNPALASAIANVTLRRFSTIATGANAASVALQITNSGACAELGFCKSNTLAPVVSIGSGSSGNELRACYLKGGLNSIKIGGTCNIFKCISDSPSSDAILQNSNVQILLLDNVIYNPGGHGISLISTLSSPVSIMGTCFHTITVAAKYPINFSGSTDVSAVDIAANTKYNCNAGTDTNGLSTGLGDVPAFDTLTESTDPYPNAASHNFVYAGTTGKGGGMPAFYFDQDDANSFLSNRDPGATDHVASGGVNTGGFGL